MANRLRVHLFVAAFLFEAVSTAWAGTGKPLTFDNPWFCNVFLERVNQASIGALEDPVTEMKRWFGVQVNSSLLRRGLYDLENDILSLFALAPQLRSLEEFGRRWNLDPEQVRDVMTYYGIRVFDGNLQVIGDEAQVLPRLSALSWDRFFRSGNPAVTRLEFYRRSVTRLSVAQMSRELGISERQVYWELQLLGISIARGFEAQPEAARESTQAAQWIQHHWGVRSRGVSWNRRLEFEGAPRSESEILLKLSERGMSISAITLDLNRLAGTGPDSAEYRSEGAVIAKLAKLQGSDMWSMEGGADLLSAEYGYLKYKGNLVPLPTIAFLRANRTSSAEELCSALQVTSDALARFVRLHHVAGLVAFDTAIPRQADRQARRYQAQVEIIAKMLVWLREHPGVMPQGKDVAQVTGYMREQIFGSSGFYKNNGIFESASALWVALYRAGLNEGVKVDLLEIFVKEEPSPELKKIQQEQAANLVIAWARSHPGKSITVFEFKESGGDIPLYYRRLFEDKGNPLFDSVEEAWVFIRAQGVAQGVRIPLFALRLDPSHPSYPVLREAMQVDSVDRVLAWMDAHQGKRPSARSFGTQEGRVGVVYEPFTGTGAYRIGGERAKHALFPNPEAAWDAVERARLSRGLP